MDPVKTRSWQLRPGSDSADLVGALARDLRLTPLVAATLARRGIVTAAQGHEFLNSRLSSLPDPFLFKDMDRAVERLARALAGGEKVSVHGDYDVDGITGTSLLVENLRLFGFDVGYHIPLRLRDGYGLSADALRQAAGQGVSVVVSVDCGVSAVDEGRLAAELGLDLIVTDHHQPPDPLPEAYAIINPHRPGCGFPFKELAGVGVAFFLLVALRKALREQGAFKRGPEPDLRRSLDLVALGTIADIVPLKGVNRSLTRFGLGLLESGQRPGVRALKEVAAVKQVSCGSVGFRLAPRLNAAGRLEDAALGAELLLTPSDSEAKKTATFLNQLNGERQQIEADTLAQAIERLESEGDNGARSIVLADRRWHPGVIGIVASRLVERYYRPVVMIALDEEGGKGSARSIKGFHLYESLSRCSEHLQGFGGHEYAAGLSLEGARVDGFARAFESVACALLDEEDLVPSLLHDGEIALEELSRQTVTELESLTPFGAGNPEPAFVATGIRVQQAAVVGGGHLRFTARQGGYSLPCIAFGMGDWIDRLAGEVDILFSAGFNEWQGRCSIQLRIKDIRFSS